MFNRLADESPNRFEPLSDNGAAALPADVYSARNFKTWMLHKVRTTPVAPSAVALGRRTG